MSKAKTPTTPAILTLKAKGIPFTLHAYAYEENGGTHISALKLGVDEHRVIKTLVMEDDGKLPFIILMHGDREVSTKKLARAMGVKWVSPCKPDVAHKHTGYVVGGTSPFGTKKAAGIYGGVHRGFAFPFDQCRCPGASGRNGAGFLNRHPGTGPGPSGDINLPFE